MDAPVYGFTVKHVAPNDVVTLWPARKVVGSVGSVDFYHTESENVVTCLSDGDVFVMNQNGKTVDRFFLGGSPDHPKG